MTEGAISRRPRLACPRCGSHAIARILYGMPADSEELERDLDAGRIVLGGCMVWDGRPDHACTACDLRFRADGRPAIPLE